ncbi:SusC/RagA family TonB-linked outer membrane protein [Sphingobacterium sp. SRCM116780]|uniref:SusC/RagA family TonB-linked outer membrane protein n=1 Tax=Sphingobacterium sp. SRCM116780 TaxID=2907623 RepID=UPI001F1575F7|nr:SusC/RagA family TonB-linked outer membrane protein [Sphingobacterium sp. SRCM116780]UIR54749.1 SusC/RagA family TonB-linked outer membrane protein [Sphingobacterium sp. SRCM116780]
MSNYLPNKKQLFTMLLLRLNSPGINWKLRLGVLGLVGMSYQVSMAQTNATVSGVVRDSNGGALASATVTIENSANNFRQVTTTQADGTFLFNRIPEGQGYTIKVNSLGFKAKTLSNYTINAKDKVAISVSLDSDSEQLQEVVVTALGIKRDKKALGYTVAELKGSELTQGKEANVANALSGKVAGVQVSRAASGAGGSAKVLIRGNNSLIGNSQPLYVVDGVPIDNQNISAPNQSGGTDYGDGIGNINPDDIESMSVLKGPNAAALYGQRGSNGVILITTKSGKAGKTSFNFNTDYSVGNGLILPDFQNEYGQGLNGTFTHFRKDDGTIVPMSEALANNYSGTPKMSGGRDRTTRASWGPRMEGQTYEDMYGNVLQLNPAADTYQSFFQTEKQSVNNLSVDGGNEKLNYRFSYANTHVDGYIPTNTLNRNNFGLRTQGKITDKLHIDVKANYIMQEANNRPSLSDAPDNPAYLFISQPRSLSNAIASQYKWSANDVSKQLGFSGVYEGLEKTYATNSSTANPFWTIYENHNEDRRDRLIGLLRLSYDFAPWLKVSATGGTDFYTDQRFRYRPINTYQSLNKKGDIREEVIRSREDNYDILASSNFAVSEDIKMSLNFGGSHQNRYLRLTGNTGNQFIVPDLFVINNTTTNSYLFDLVESQINSAYLSGQFSFRDYWFVDFSARNDWSSTLSKENNSFFYPSVSSSLVLTDAFKWKSPTLSYAKIRASWAQAGNSGNPYQLTGAYSLNQFTHGGIPMASYTEIIPDPNLKNELTTSIEAGADFRLFKNRLSLSFTYYQAKTKNQILDVPISPSSLYVKNRINAGEISNKGFEFVIGGSPIKTDNFEWASQFNFNRNRNKVESLYPGVETFLLATDRGINVVAEVGKPFGQLKGTQFAWIKDEQGNRLIDPKTGLPLRTSGRVETDLGNAQPDWIGGFSNTLTYKGVSLYALVDIRQGGVIFSQSNREQIIYGTTNKTLEGRDGTYVAAGMIGKQDANGEWSSTGVQNSTQVTAQAYWNMVASDKEVMVSEEMINDMSYVAMREISLSYNLPKKFMPHQVIRNIKVGLYGRNLFYFQRKTDGFSPEASAFNVNNSSIGIESTSLPMMRTFGINLSVGL